MIKTDRLWKVGAMTLLLFVFVVARLGYLQIYCHADLYQRAERESVHQVIDHPRGAIRRGADSGVSV